MKIYNCEVNHLERPLGFQMDKTVFSWRVAETDAKAQKSARLLISKKADLSQPEYDSGPAQLDSVACTVPLVLAKRTRYYWTVEVVGDNGETAVSEINWFETAKQDEPWQAKWITCENQPRHPIFSKDIAVKEAPVCARLYICGLGLYEAAINGKKVGDEILAPYCNNYKEWIQYQTYDVTEALRSGGRLDVTVGHGWYSGRLGYMSVPGDPGHYGSCAKLIAELHIAYGDGSEDVICTDESWTVTRSTILDSSIYDGETRDDTLSATAPETVSLTTEAAALVARYSPPVRVRENLAPLELIHTPAGELVLDIGQNMVGTFALKVNRPAGTKVFVQVGEVMQKGCFYNENLRTAKAEYTYISDGSQKTVVPSFTFYGFRYVKIEGIPDLREDDFTALALYSEIPQRGVLTTGHAKVNRLIHNVEWGQKSNFLDVPTDCPQRDERLGWTGDAQVFSATACYLRQCYPFFRKYLHDMATEQKNLEGMVPEVVPALDDPAYHCCAAVWSDAATIIPWNLYSIYGDRTILEEQFESMAAWVDYITKLDGDDHGWSRQFHYGDWLALDHPDHRPDQCLGGTDVAYISQVYYRNSARIVADAAALLGRTAEAQKYSALADRLTAWLVEEFFSPNGRCCVDTQTGLVLALRHELSPRKESCVSRLSQKLDETRGKLQTGFVGTPFLCAALTENGMEHDAYDLLLNEEYPGWLYEVNLGATTVWERWNSMEPDGSVSSTGMNSFNHYAYGSIVQWICEYAAGLKPAQAGFRKAVIAPVPDFRLGKLDYTYESAAGRYRVCWETPDKTTLHLTVEVPFGCQAELKLPYCAENAVRTLTAGRFDITYTTNRPMARSFHVDMTMKELLRVQTSAEALNQLVPGITRVPQSKRHKTLRELLASMAHMNRQQIEQIDTMLRKV